MNPPEEPKYSFARPLLIIAALSLSISIGLHFLQEKPIENKNMPTGQVAGVSTVSLPIRLTIPVIGIDSNIQYVGMNEEGEMASPSNTSDVAWYKNGTIPGEKGSAVIAGHLDGKEGEKAVFADLSKLKTGDTIYIQKDNGTKVEFAVREIRTYDSGYADMVFNLSDYAHLNLITCSGVWNETEKSYDKRLVVFTDLVKSI